MKRFSRRKGLKREGTRLLGDVMEKSNSEHEIWEIFIEVGVGVGVGAGRGFLSPLNLVVVAVSFLCFFRREKAAVTLWKFGKRKLEDKINK